MALDVIDELAHAPPNDLLWRESLYFCFHDSHGRIGGMATIGIWPPRNRGEGFAAVFLETGQTLFYHTQVTLHTPESSLLAVSGIHCTMLVPFREWRLVVQSDFQPGGGGAVSRGAHPPGPAVPVYLALDFHAVGPAYEYPATLGLLTGPARHYEQSGHMLGRVIVGGRLYAVMGLGCRDHSWGLRDPACAGDIVVVLAQFSPHLAVNVVCGRNAGQEVALGTILFDGTNLPVTAAAVDVTTDTATGWPQSVQVEARTTDGRVWRLGGTVRAVLPILLPTGAAPLRWYECSTRFRHDGATGYGIVTCCEQGAGLTMPDDEEEVS